MKKKIVFIVLVLTLAFSAVEVYGQSREAERAFYLGEYNLKNKNYNNAIEAYTEAIKLYPNYTEAFSGRGTAYFCKNDFDNAIADNTKAIQLEPTNWSYFSSRALAYYFKKDYDRAIADFETALKINPNHADSKEFLAKARQAKGASSTSNTQQQQPTQPSMVLIKGGTFTMGSPASETGRNINESPQHQVTVNSFYMSKYEVTQKEYREVMGTDSIDEFTGDNFPVVSIIWFDAVEYCNKRSQKERLTPAYTIEYKEDPNFIVDYQRIIRTVTWNKNANGYRLPTEAEWEYACRAGTTTAFNTGTSFSNNTGWYGANRGKYLTNPVGQKSANAWGLYDMHGNASEWCWDWFGNYSSGSQNNPSGAISGSERVIRGGSWWSDSVENLRSASRGKEEPHNTGNNQGFRVVRNAQ